MKISVTITEKWRYRKVASGLEVPCTLTFTSVKKTMIDHLKKLV